MDTTRLDGTHLEAILGLVRRVAACDDMDAFRSELVESLGDVIDGDLHHLADIDAGTGELAILQHPTPLPPEVAMAAFAHRHPIVERYLGTGDGSAVRLSDLVTPEDSQRGRGWVMVNSSTREFDPQISQACRSPWWPATRRLLQVDSDQPAMAVLDHRPDNPLQPTEPPSPARGGGRSA